jgi:hypothetical protein
VTAGLAFLRNSWTDRQAFSFFALVVAEGFLEPASDLCGSFKHGLELRLIDLFLQAPLHLARMKTRGRSLLSPWEVSRRFVLDFGQNPIGKQPRATQRVPVIKTIVRPRGRDGALAALAPHSRGCRRDSDGEALTHAGGAMEAEGGAKRMRATFFVFTKPGLTSFGGPWWPRRHCGQPAW